MGGRLRSRSIVPAMAGLSVLVAGWIVLATRGFHLFDDTGLHRLAGIEGQADTARPSADWLKALGRTPGATFRALVWNVHGSSFVKAPADFRAVVRAVDPDILLLDEVAGSSSEQELRGSLRGIRGGEDTIWHVAFGAGGGYQRSVIASRLPVTPAPDFAWIAYPSPAADSLLDMVADGTQKARLEKNLAEGVGTNAAVVEAGGRTLLVVVADFQCCGNGPASWQEQRRRLEGRLIHRAVQLAVQHTPVSGVLLGGDLNPVAGETPLDTLRQPLNEHHGSLVLTEPRHLFSDATWTWDGRGTRFPSSALTRMLYGPRSLEALRGFVFDTEDLPSTVVHQLGLRSSVSKELSDQRPVIVDFRWRNPAR